MARTVIQVSVPEVETITRRLDHPPVCPHITLLGPFVDLRDVEEVTLTWWSEDVAEDLARFPLRHSSS